MEKDLRLELVVTRSSLPPAEFAEAMDALLDIEEYAAERGYILHFALGICNTKRKPA
jgi:hypothetical protein